MCKFSVEIFNSLQWWASDDQHTVDGTRVWSVILLLFLRNKLNFAGSHWFLAWNLVCSHRF